MHTYMYTVWVVMYEGNRNVTGQSPADDFFFLMGFALSPGDQEL